MEFTSQTSKGAENKKVEKATATNRRTKSIVTKCDQKAADSEAGTSIKKNIPASESTPPRKIKKGAADEAGHSGADRKDGDDGTSWSDSTQSDKEGPSSNKTPTKEGARSDGHISTPQKRKIDFNFWESLSVQTKNVKIEEGIGAIQVADLTPGEFLTRVLKFRVTFKSPPNPKACTFHALDETGEVAIVGFGEVGNASLNAVEVNHVYSMTDFRVKEESTRFKRGCSSHYEIILKESSILKKEADETGFPKIPFSIQVLSQIEDKEPGTDIDTIGVLVKDWGVENVGQGKRKRDLSITDGSMKTINATLWGSAAEAFSSELYSPIAFRKAVVARYEGKTSLNCYANTLVWVSPEVDEVQQLMSWFENEIQKRKN